MSSNVFRMSHGDYYWPEHDTRLSVTPILLYAGAELSFATAIRRGILRKTDKSGTYVTSASCMRILITASSPVATIDPINTVIQFRERGKDIYIAPYPEEIKELCSESGFFVIAHNTYTPSSVAELAKIYPHHIIKALETVDDVSVMRGSRLCSILNDKEDGIKKSRFA